MFSRGHASVVVSFRLFHDEDYQRVNSQEWLENFLFLTPACVVVGILSCRGAYLKRHNSQPFHVRDLFANRRSRDKSKQQLLIEGLLGIGFGVAALVILFFGY